MRCLRLAGELQALLRHQHKGLGQKVRLVGLRWLLRVHGGAPAACGACEARLSLIRSSSFTMTCGIRNRSSKGPRLLYRSALTPRARLSPRDLTL